MTKRWEELNGENHWKGLLDPLDIDLRRHILHYGDMVQAMYDAFNSEKASEYEGCSRYASRNLFEKLGMSTSQKPFPYKVTKYLYASSGLSLPPVFYVRSNWIGYVALATDDGKKLYGRRDIVIVWRGTLEVYILIAYLISTSLYILIAPILTKQTLEWVNNLNANMVPANDIFVAGDFDGDVPYVHHGWLDIYTNRDPESRFNRTSSVRDQVLSEIGRLVQEYREEVVSITIAGHSMGAAVATLNAVDILQNGYNMNFPVTAILFGSPRVGDTKFFDIFNTFEKLRLLRIHNAGDIVPAYPFINYSHVGDELGINTKRSPYLKPTLCLVARHNLEGYLHGVAGHQGIHCGFKLEVDRDIALVNKKMDNLKEEYRVPAKWWVEKNKGMIRGDDGHWRLKDHEDELPN